MKLLKGDDDMTTNIFTIIGEMKNQIILYQKSKNPIKNFMGFRYKKKMKVIIDKFKNIDITYDMLYIFIDFAMSNNIIMDKINIGKKYGINMIFPYMKIKSNKYDIYIELNNPNILVNITDDNTMVKYELYQKMYSESDSKTENKIIDKLNKYISTIIYDAMIIYLNQKEDDYSDTKY